MEFKIIELLKHSPDKVYQTYRDRLPDLVPYLPNVDVIERLERQETPGGVKHVFRWKVSGAIPRAVRPFFSDKMMTYLDRNEWFDEVKRVDWRFEIGIFPDAVDCHGTNFFTAGKEPGTAEIALTGFLNIDLAKVKGVPRLLHGLASTVEKFLLDQVRPNLMAVTKAVGQYLDEHRE
jgi:hypothetical protein